MLYSDRCQDDGDDCENCQNMKTEQDWDQFDPLRPAEAAVEGPGARQQGEDHGGQGGDVSGRGRDGECWEEGGAETAEYRDDRAGVGWLVRAHSVGGEVEAQQEVEEEGEGGGELVPRPGQPQSLTAYCQHLEDAGQGEGGVDRDLVGGGEEVPVVSVEEDGAQGGEAAEENITDGGVGRQGGGPTPQPAQLSEHQPRQPTEAQQSEESPLQHLVVTSTTTSTTSITLSVLSDRTVSLHEVCLLPGDRSGPDWEYLPVNMGRGGGDNR